ncbi:30S ribosomal protein S1 [Lactiplantibacillus pentosus]|jgi:small subunit ribosomal protein S1|uniref:Ribosomal protein S1 n=1 Tax=Lactiplantibacillus pentosus IG1 TaxID=1042160 RepID=G0LZL9_LACPE|nr:30S ribosomal protein S1 [Lactiplantibacillus pentosus]CCC18127.1 ribosomal protein S1 [Lactiplantibacillus pentosus IG1]AYG37486.1 30S ribosomal protein S1 [Lactiplantibacillus pentosus]AYG40143.1 30S ribosomal protein S1 [Lactiplantibacillus pentosus]MCJ8179851.1 30S ribosomal protein S1 [Lactiplantibacillus pentosus]MCT3285096.1 30S ribosomal protein S1 [Lactiplantibacillus pentosus]
MSENENSQEKNELLDALNSVEEVNVGDVVKGEVLAIDDDKQVIVGIQGTGVEGVVPLKELSTQRVDDVNEAAKVGDVLDLVVISRIGSDKENGSYLLSHRRLEARKVWDDVEKEYEAGHTIKAPVTQVVKGGLVVDAGVRGFIPASMIDDHYVEDLNAYKGQELELKIIEIEPSENRLILSHRAVVEKQREAQREEALKTLQAGDVVEGKVARLTNFGAFVDLGGIDGLVHVSEISYERVEKPADVLKVGQEVKVKILSVDADRERVSLSIKATLPEPWDGIEEKAPQGAVLDGKVKRLTSFGAFVEVFPGVEGLVHISQISHQHIATPNDVLKVGQEIKVKVLDVRPDEKRLALSIKALEEKPQTADDDNESQPERRNNNNRRRNNNRDNRTASERSTANAPEESTGFTLGDLIGDELKNAENNNDEN